MTCRKSDINSGLDQDEYERRGTRDLVSPPFAPALVSVSVPSEHPDSVARCVPPFPGFVDLRSDSRLVTKQGS